MEILIVAKTFHPPYATGYTAYCKGLLQSISRIKGVDVTVISTLRPRRYLRDTIEKDVLAHGYREWLPWLTRCKACQYLEEQVKNRYVSFYALAKEVANILKDVNYDFIHDLVGLDMLWLKLLRTKLNYKTIVFRHVLTPGNSTLSRLKQYLFNKIVFKRITPVFTTKRLANIYGVRSGGVIIPPAIDTDFFKPMKLDHNTSHDYILLYMGPVAPDRFPPQVIKSLALLKSWTNARIVLKIVSAPWRTAMELDYVKTLKRLISKLDLEKAVELKVKTLTPLEKLRLLNECDIFLQIFNESFTSIVPVDPPITMLEAMACARKVVVSRCKSLSFQDIIKHGVNGYIINSISEVEIANIIHNAMLDRKAIGINARKLVEHYFSINATSMLIKRLYSSLRN